MIVTRTCGLALMTRLAAAGGLALAVAIWTGMAPPAAAGQLFEPPADHVRRWLECRAAAARIEAVARADPMTGLSARLTPLEREAMHARLTGRRITQRLEAMDMSGRTSEELEALAAHFTRYFDSAEGARRAPDVLAACEAELSR